MQYSIPYIYISKYRGEKTNNGMTISCYTIRYDFNTADNINVFGVVGLVKTYVAGGAERGRLYTDAQYA